MADRGQVKKRFKKCVSALMFSQLCIFITLMPGTYGQGEGSAATFPHQPLPPSYSSTKKCPKSVSNIFREYLFIVICRVYEALGQANLRIYGQVG